MKELFSIYGIAKVKEIKSLGLIEASIKYSKEKEVLE
jgi:hypothetical protein